MTDDVMPALQRTRPAADTPLHLHLVLSKAYTGGEALRPVDLRAAASVWLEVVSVGVSSHLALVELVMPPPPEDRAAHDHATYGMVTYLMQLEDVGSTEDAGGRYEDGVTCVYAAAHWAGVEELEEILRESSDVTDGTWLDGEERLPN